MGYRERRILSRYKPQWIWTTNTQGLIRKREEEELEEELEEEEEDTTAMQEADPGGEMTAELGTKSDAMNVAQQEQEVLKHVAENFVGTTTVSRDGLGTTCVGNAWTCPRCGNLDRKTSITWS